MEQSEDNYSYTMYQNSKDAASQDETAYEGYEVQGGEDFEDGDSDIYATLYQANGRMLKRGGGGSFGGRSSFGGSRSYSYSRSSYSYSSYGYYGGYGGYGGGSYLGYGGYGYYGGYGSRYGSAYGYAGWKRTYAVTYYPNYYSHCLANDLECQKDSTRASWISGGVWTGLCCCCVFASSIC